MVLQMDHRSLELDTETPREANRRALVSFNWPKEALGMDRLKKTRYAVKRSLQSGVRRVPRGQMRRTPILAREAARHRVGDDAPELICECSLIPFPHFMVQCWRLLCRESEDWQDASS